MINLEVPRKFLPLLGRARRFADEVMRPISRKYDKQGNDLASTASNEFFVVTAAVLGVEGTYVNVRVQATWKNEMRPSVNRVVTLNGRIRQRGGT